MIAGSVLLLCSLCGGAAEQVLDDFDYADTAAAQAAWKASSETPAVEMIDAAGTRAMQMAAPFATNAKLPRTVLDRQVQLDLAAVGEFALRVSCDHPEAAGQMTLYFHSQNGWYGASLSVDKPGWQTVSVSKASFHTEGTPAGWHAVDGVRLSAWRARDVDATIQFDRLVARAHDLALVVPAMDSDDPEAKAAQEAADLVAGMLADLGLGADAIAEPDLMRGALGPRKLVILAHNPRLGAEAAEVLRQFVTDGGKLFACYQLREELAQAIGVGTLHYVRPKDFQLAEVRCDASAVAGLPAQFRQASWNITTAEPAGYGARVVGQWFDAAGKPTGLAALVVSQRGAFFSHVILSDDPVGKRQMLAAVLGNLVPSLWPEMAETALSRAAVVGPFDEGTQVAEFVRASGQRGAQNELAAAEAELASAKADVAQGRFPQAIERAGVAHRRLAEAYLRAVPSRKPEGRAWWNHSGTGAYPGDWERTARELEAAGFNMILPNMLWGGLAHYSSDVLPRSSTFEEHGDQIAQCVDAAHRHGLEVHVWKVNYNLSNAPDTFVESMRSAGRTQVSASGEPIDWLCPSHPENRKLEVASMVEVARKYEVDGLHFDYIRYPDGDACYCQGCRQRFQADTGKTVTDWPRQCYSGDLREAYRAWRCQQITALVADVAREARAVRPGVLISAAVFGFYPSCRESVGQDWPVWAKEGYVDFLCPMDYTESDVQFVSLVQDQLERVGGRVPLYPGIGATASRMGLSADRVAGQIMHARRLGAAGFTIFNLSPGTAEDLLPTLHLGPTSLPAAPPHQGGQKP